MERQGPGANVDVSTKIRSRLRLHANYHGRTWLYVSWYCDVSLRCCTETEFGLQVVVSCTALFQLGDLLATRLRSADHLGGVTGGLARKAVKVVSCTKTELNGNAGGEPLCNGRT